MRRTSCAAARRVLLTSAFPLCRSQLARAPRRSPRRAMASASASQHGRCLSVFTTRLGPGVPCADSVVCALCDVLFELDRDGVGAGSERDARVALGDMLDVLQMHADDGRVFAAGCCVVYHLLTLYRLEGAPAKVAAETVLHVQREREREAQEAQAKQPVPPVSALQVLHTALFDLGAAFTQGELALARRMYLIARNATPEESLTHVRASEYLAASAGGLPPVSGSPAYAEAQAARAAAAAARAADREAAKKAAAEAHAMIDVMVSIAKPLIAALDAAASAVERALLGGPPTPPTEASRPRRASDVLSSEELNAAAEAWDKRRSDKKAAKAKAAADEAKAVADEAAAAADEAAEAAVARAESAAQRDEDLAAQLKHAHLTDSAVSGAAGAAEGAAPPSDNDGKTGADAAEAGPEP